MLIGHLGQLKLPYAGVLFNTLQKGHGVMGMDRITDRVGFDIEDGMVVELEPFTDEYPRPRHASFVRNISRSSGGLDGIGEEIQLYRRHYLNK